MRRALQRFLVPLGPLLAFSGCGGGTATAPPPPSSPPPQPDFSISFSLGSVSLQQGLSSSAVSLSVAPTNGFAGAVQVTLTGLPAGVSSNPASPFSANASSSTPIVFSAAASANTGNFTVAATASSGSLSHSANLALSVQTGVVAANLPRTTYIRTDSVPSSDDPSGEPHHRHLVYDAAHQLVFVANRAMNCVEVFSASTAQRTGEVSIPGASSADLSADGSTVWVGTVTEIVGAIDTASLQIKARYELSGLQPLPNTLFDRPEEVLALVSGKLLMRLRQAQTAEALLAIWDPSSNTLTNLTFTAPQLFQNGLGAIARSGDHTKVLVAAGDSSGEIAVYDANGNVLAGPHGLGAGTIPLVAANPDATRFAVQFTANGATRILLLDGAFNVVGTYATTVVNGMVFSTDGQFLYVSENSGAPPVITALDGHSAEVVGQVPDLWIAGRRSEIEDVDATHLLFGLANRGVSLLDAAHPASLPTTTPSFVVPPVAQPSEGPPAGGTSTVLSGQNFEPMAQLLFGAQSGLNVSVTGNTQLSATSPNSVAGTVNLTAYFPSGWLALAPDAFSYGPQILRVLPNAGSPAGGDVVQIYGYGFGGDATKITAMIGGANATIQRVDNVTTIAPSLGLEATYPFPVERLTVQTPQGTSGKADIAVTSPSGSAAQAKAFQFLQSETFYPKPSFDKFVLYDKSRQWLYLSNIDHVDVFDLSAGAFHSTGLEPPGGPPPNAELRGLALTPDGAQLVSADFAAQNIYLLNPDTGSGTAVAVGGVPGFANSGPARVAATSTQSVFVGLSAESQSSGSCTSCLGQLNLTGNPPAVQPASQPEVTSLTGAPLVQANGTGDRVFVAFGSAPGAPLALWNSSAPNQFTTFTANDPAGDLAASADGNAFAVHANGAIEIRGQDFSLSAIPANPELAQIPGRVEVPGGALHPSGALLYQPFLTGQPGVAGVQGGVDILDAHSGVLRLRILLPQQFMTDVDGLHGSFFTIDENGQRLFAITSKDGTAQNAGLTIATLAAVPLGIGTLAPAQAPAAGGTSLVVRGSGFKSGVAVFIGGKAANTTFNDMNTLTVVTPALAAGPQRVTIANPDGETVSLDAAFVAN